MELKEYLEKLNGKLKDRILVDQDIMSILQDAHQYEKTLKALEFVTDLYTTVNNPESHAFLLERIGTSTFLPDTKERAKNLSTAVASLINTRESFYFHLTGGQYRHDTILESKLPGMLKQLHPFLSSKGNNCVSSADCDKMMRIVYFVSRRLKLPEDLECVFSRVLIEHSTILDTLNKPSRRAQYFNYVNSLLKEMKKIAIVSEQNVVCPREAPVYREDREPSPPPPVTDNSGDYVYESEEDVEVTPERRKRKSVKRRKQVTQ